MPSSSWALLLPNVGIEPRYPALQADSLLSEPPGKTKNTEVVAYPFSKGSSQPRGQTRVSCIAGGFLPAELPGKPFNLNINTHIFLSFNFGYFV